MSGNNFGDRRNYVHCTLTMPCCVPRHDVFHAVLCPTPCCITPCCVPHQSHAMLCPTQCCFTRHVVSRHVVSHTMLCPTPVPRHVVPHTSPTPLYASTSLLLSPDRASFRRATTWTELMSASTAWGQRGVEGG